MYSSTDEQKNEGDNTQTQIGKREGENSTSL
jgi:hypothetical protein